MRDDRARWDAPQDHTAAMTVGGATLQEVTLTRQTLISGTDVRRTTGPVIGWPDIVGADRYVLCLRRDRVLVVNGEPMATGWDSSTQTAVSDMTHGYRVFDLTGPAAHDVLRRGAEIELTSPSPSVARQMFGLGAFVYRVSHPDHLRVHVATAQAEAMYGHLTAALQATADALPL